MKVTVEIRDNSMVTGEDGTRPRESVWWQTYKTRSQEGLSAQQEAVVRARIRWPNATSWRAIEVKP